ncbi:neural/ectodermal development factor IMP-L2-like [Battus philenor]|uniref:neural/ectodermal development factor IMP-L2-like n=1 Tax=Battus philenor TaxID=42288 RepID=UPI0035CF9972
MFNAVLLFATAALLCDSGRSANVNKHMKLLEIDSRVDMQSQHTLKKFLTLLKNPNPVIFYAGVPLELTCEAIGSPAPSIHWFKNDAPIYQYDEESNEVIDTNPTSLGRVSSTLLVARPDRAEYSCLAVAGTNTARAVTTIHTTNGANDISERTKLIPLAPRILVTYKVFVDLIGNNVVLPCRVKGHPRPKIAWRDNGGRPVGLDPRMKVLRSGELVISRLLWSDMGEFTCQATNVFGSQLARTFVYPARAE